MINSRNIDDLDPVVRTVCKAHLALCRTVGIELLVTSTYRDYESQDALYAIGRTVQVERSKVTNAKAGKSWHNFRCAYDVVPLVNGKPVWKASDPIWKDVVALGKQAGAEAGAEWKTFKDQPHFQVRPTENGALIALNEAMTRFNSNGTIFI